MTDVSVRQINNDLEQPRYRWYSQESGEQGVCTLAELVAMWPEASLTLLISGADCPSRRMTFNSDEKRHLARLMPYELETDLAQDVNGVHVALGLPVQGNKNPDPQTTGQSQDFASEAPEVVLSYMDKRGLAARIEVLEGAGFDVRHCYAEPLLLPGSAGLWILRLVADQVDISWGVGCAASVELSMLGVFLESLSQAPAGKRAPVARALLLQALTTEELDILKRQVSATDVARHWKPEVTTELLDSVWYGLAGVGAGAASKSNRVATTTPDLRQGAFSRPLQWQKIWRPARLPVVAAALAALTFAAVTVIETQLNNQRLRSLQQDIEVVYRDVVPNGMLVDAEQQLRAQLGQLRGGSGDVSVMVMLDKITPQLSQNTKISINRLSYNGSSSATVGGELQLSVEAASNTDILQFSDQLNNSGLQARTQNMTQAGNRQQASILITETAP